MERHYLTTAETAKVLRVYLKAAFPGVKFSVRSKNYSGGSSIDVEWRDGPTCKQVERVAKPAEGAEFDGMIDLKTYRRTFIEGAGLAGESGADFIFCNRFYSVEFLTACASKIAKEWSCAPVEIKDTEWGAHVKRSPVCPGSGYRTLDELVMLEASETEGVYA